MKYIGAFLLLLSLIVASSPSAAENEALVQKQTRKTEIQHHHLRGLAESNEKELTLNILNLTFRQPFSHFFVLVHNSQAKPLYTAGRPASNGLATLAEFGSPDRLIQYYTQNTRGVKSATRFNSVTSGGQTSQITVTVSDQYPLVSIASMCENTNDCFVALNGVNVKEGMVLDEPGLDAGSEENNESCVSVPGPACAGLGKGIERSRNGEGYIHVHRGVLGVGDLERDLDWRNPMMRVTVTNANA